MRVLVLGGTRFIGRALVERLAADSHDLAVVHRGSALGGRDAELPPGVEEFLLDRAELPGHADQLRRWQPQVVVDMYAMTQASARAALEALATSGLRWVVASSLDVYRAYDHLQGRAAGPPPDGPLTEDSPLRTRLYPYRGSGRDAEFAIDDYEKIEVERTVREWPHIQPVVLRLPAVYGPRDQQHRLAADLDRMDRGVSTITLGRSEAAWRFAMGYVDDMGAALALAAVHPAARGTYVVAEPHTPSRLERLTALAEEAGWDGAIEVAADDEVPDGRRASVDYRQHMSADSAKIRRELGYDEETPFREALRRTIAWEREQRALDTG